MINAVRQLNGNCLIASSKCPTLSRVGRRVVPAFSVPIPRERWLRPVVRPIARLLHVIDSSCLPRRQNTTSSHVRVSYSALENADAVSVAEVVRRLRKVLPSYADPTQTISYTLTDRRKEDRRRLY